MTSLNYSKRDALSALRQRLLDLSNRSVFINHKDPFLDKSCIPFFNFHASTILQEILRGTQIEIKTIPDPIKAKDGTPSFTKETWVTDNLSKFEKESNENFQLQTELCVFEHDSDFLQKLARLLKKNKQTIEEAGVSSLFLIFGFLEYSGLKDAPQLAPLINVPIDVTRKDGALSWVIQYTGAPLVENYSIKEKLAQDFNISLPTNWDIDETSLIQYLEEIQYSIKALDWKVKPYLCISAMSSLNMVLFNDLKEDRWDLPDKNLLEIDTISELLEVANHAKTDEIYQYDIDSIDMSNPDYPLLIEHCDSSQLNAILNVLNIPENQVIIGPPGTGKSQTITNLIAALLQKGKKVLFVSEKKAALDIVHQRLQKAGLTPFLLSLHNNKISKKDIVSSLIESMDAAIEPVLLFTDEAKLEASREHLARYCYSLNESKLNGLSYFDLIWKKEQLALSPQIPVDSEYVEPHLLNFFFENEKELIKDFERLTELYCRVGRMSKENLFNLIEYTQSSDLEFGQHSAIDVLRLIDINLKESKKLIEGLGLDTALLHYDLPQLNSELTIKCESLKNTIKQTNPILNLKKMCEVFEKISLTDGIQLCQEVIRLKTSLQHNNQVCQSLKEKMEFLIDYPEDFIHELLRLSNENISEEDKLEPITVSNNSIIYFMESSKKITQVYQSNTFKKGNLLKTLAELQANRISFKYLNEVMLDSKHYTSHLKVIKLKLEIDRITDSLDIYVPTQEEVYEEIISILDNFVSVCESPFKYFNSSWYKGLSLYKKLQKNKLNVISSNAKKDSLLLLFDIYQKYSELNDLVQKLPSESKIKADGLFFEADVANEELTFVKKNKNILTDLLGDPVALSELKVLFTLNLPLYQEAFLYFEKTGWVLPDVILQDTSKVSTYVSSIGKNNVYLCDISLFKKSQTISEQAKCKLQELSVVYPHIVPLEVDAISEILQTAYFLRTTSLEGMSAVYSQLKSCTTVESVLSKLSYLGQEGDRLTTLLRQLSNSLIKMEHANKLIIKSPADLFEIKRLLQLLDNIQINPNLISDWVSASAIRNLWLNVNPIFKEIFEKDFGGHTPLALLNELLKQAYELKIKENIFSDTFLATIVGEKNREIQNTFIAADENLIQANRKRLKNKLISERTIIKGESAAKVKDYTEGTLLKHLKKTPGARVSLRDIFVKAKYSVQELFPCFLMGPQAVAQYLAPNNFNFDVLIIDEASQMRLEHSLGAIARSRQVVVVGDPQQLGPSSSFKSSFATEGEAWAILETESVLSWARNKYKESNLNWHYRSKHQSLIDFSNKQFYGDSLIVVPSCEEKNELLGLNYHYLEDGLYDERTNEKEIDEIVKKAVAHMEHNKFLSLGIVTLNLYQADEIEKEISKQSLLNPAIAEYMQKWEELKEPFFVKNLENVQGDERDCIYISLTFGKGLKSKEVYQNFGLISREDGGRRLNVLVTRAKKTMHVFSSLRSGEIKMDSKTPRGTLILRNFIEFCELNKAVLLQEGSPESPFEKVICNVLSTHGYAHTCQLGIAGYRIDIAVKNPYGAGFMAAIECDGASYHSAACVKDRDKLRQSVLEQRGWSGSIYRIWSIDWLMNKELETKKLLSFLAAKEANLAS